MDTANSTTPQASKPEENQKPKTKNLKTAAIVVGSLFAILVIFAAGVAVGLKKARFSADFGRNYERNFLGSRFDQDRGMPGRSGPIGGMMREFSGRDFRNAHGISGTIISITENNLIIKDRDNKENTVAVTDKTVIKKGRDNAQLSDLKQNDQVVIIGKPGDNGVINADLIRVFNNPINN
ncbi:MAG: hypothetical protein CO141_00675 [Candidatus Moranbacteria bacterium CG_4_9_14_3_um_filter_42_9]|nr:MAG: hypothetical protein CO141_00675 [Candidatus Moranbacteria bacterium CG_4_9_14_3_um_filter_42_9]